MTLNALVHVLILRKSENIKYFLVLRYSLFCDILRDIFLLEESCKYLPDPLTTDKQENHDY